MPDMKTPRHAMPAQDPQIRSRNFEEVALGYTKETAMAEALRCLNCKNKTLRGQLPRAGAYPGFHQTGCRGRF